MRAPDCLPSRTVSLLSAPGCCRDISKAVGQEALKHAVLARPASGMINFGAADAVSTDPTSLPESELRSACELLRCNTAYVTAQA